MLVVVHHCIIVDEDVRYPRDRVSLPPRNQYAIETFLDEKSEERAPYCM
jgi:hypothetical protein